MIVDRGTHTRYFRGRFEWTRQVAMGVWVHGKVCDSVADCRGNVACVEPGPLGHVVVDPDGRVLEANLAASRLLSSRGSVVGTRLSDHVRAGVDDLRLRRHLFHAFSSRERSTCQLELARADGTAHRVRLESIADPYQRKCLMVIFDLEPSPREGGAVLVVEDERLVRLTIRHYLEVGGYQVVEAHSVDDAVAACEGLHSRIELLISDVVLPGMCGPEVAAQVSRLLPGLRVLFISAHPKQLLVDTRRLEPDAELLQKPFSGDELLACVRGDAG